MIQNETFENRPVTMNPKNNLLEIEEHMYILDDVAKPNVFRNMFPYSEIPMTGLCLIICPERSGSQIPPSVTASSPERHTPRSRL